jgi:hypothetical protein
MSDSEARKKATIDMARDFYEAMPDAPKLTINGEPDWGTISITKHYNFCMRIAAAIVAANVRTFKL